MKRDVVRLGRQKGHAVVEFAMVLPLVAMLLIGIVEVGNAINAYLTIEEASRDSARLITREGPTANINGLVKILTHRLPTSNLITKASYNTDSDGNKEVTVEVNYDYKFLLGAAAFVQKMFPGPLTLSARTTMPIP